MPLELNIRHLKHNSVTLRGDLPAAELGLDEIDELIHATLPLRHDLVAERYEHGILLQGSLKITLQCECSRCLKTYSLEVNLDPWSCLLPLEGVDRVAVNNDCVDLTPCLREDIVLALPQHPLCEPACRGLPAAQTRFKPSGGAEVGGETASPWAELNKLKL